MTQLFTTPAPVFTTTAFLTVNAANHVDIAANLNRVEIFLSNTDANNEVYVRDQAATTDTSGILLSPKQTLVLATTAALRITNATAGNVVVSMNEARSS